MPRAHGGCYWCVSRWMTGTPGTLVECGAGVTDMTAAHVRTGGTYAPDGSSAPAASEKYALSRG